MLRRPSSDWTGIRLVKTTIKHTLAVLAVALFLIVCILLAPVAGDAQSNPGAGPGHDVAPTCTTVSAKTFNKALRTRRELGGKKPKQFAHKPVCVRPDYRRVQAQIKRLKRAEARRLETNPVYAIRKAFDPIGRTGEALRVARCESTLNRFARNSGGYSGLFQLGSHHFHRLRGLPWYHAYANARAAAEIVAGDGGWGQWVCRP